MSIAKVKCGACRSDVALPSFTMAFQPIVDIDTTGIYAYEALVRPTGGGSAADVLSRSTSTIVTALTRLAGSRPSSWRRDLKWIRC